MKKEKVVFISSPGGHLIQLNLLANKLDSYDAMFVSTYKAKPSFINTDNYSPITDFSRDDIYKIFLSTYEAIKIIISFKPDAIITTGAAPGLIFVILARLMNKKSIWVDSMANYNKLSLSGRLAKLFRCKVFSQSEKVANKYNVEYSGSVI
ncbi:hypothetical protein [uncultured Vibrio sp.]|uniref:hypothetical protein n=1 Tax=uncultured Vibrio sp. TaxID=114054 RepID=UPI0026063D7D|nr:hypothetical protein [uncultured Vibrio sp.]